MTSMATEDDSGNVTEAKAMEDETISTENDGTTAPDGDSKTNDADEDEDMSKATEDSTKARTTRVRKALFTAIEGGSDEDGDEDPLSHRPLVRLFESPKEHRKINPEATSREVKDMIFDTVRGFHKGYARRLFAGLKPIVKRVCGDDVYVPESVYQDDEKTLATADDHTIAPEDITPDAASSEALLFLHYAVRLLQIYLDSVVEKHAASRRKSHIEQSIPVIAEAFDVAEIVHEIMLPLHTCGPDAVPVQNAVLNLCESWWHANAPQRELIVLQVLPLLVLRALGTDDKPPQRSDIKRLLKIQDAFKAIEFNDETSDGLRSLLLKVASSPLCLKLNEGKRFVAGLFLLEPSLVRDLHQAIKIQIPEAKKPILQAYGEIYKRAWKESKTSYDCSPETRTAIEQDVLQDFMYAVLHMQKPKMTRALLVVLEPFHEAKKSSDVESLLHRMYGPILWRALSATHPQVRINAATILGEVFPLHEPSHVHPEVDFKRGADALKALLLDGSHRVRVAASEVVAKVLGTYWDVFSTENIRTLLTIVISKHTSDVSSYQVRVAALDAVSVLLDSPQSHAVLRGLLPALGNLIHDVNKHVRLAAVNLLLKVKKLKGIKYYHVVPVDHLKARLEDDGRNSAFLYQSPVASGLTKLMLNSFVPQGPNVSAVDQIKRTLSFLSSDPDAAAVFYANLADHLPTMAIAKLTGMLLRCLTSAIETEKQKAAANGTSIARKRSRDDDNSDSESNSGSEEEANDENGTMLTASNTSLMATLAEVISSLWESILDDLEYEDNDDCHKFLVDSFSGTTLTIILEFFEKQERDCEEDMMAKNDYIRIHAALLRCAGFLHPEDVEGLVSHVTRSLQALSNHHAGQRKVAAVQKVSVHIALLSQWDMIDDVAVSLASSIVSGFDEGGDSFFSPVSDTRGKRKSGSSGRRKSDLGNCLVPSLDPGIAIDALSAILHGSDPGSLASRNSLFSSTKARETVEEAFERVTYFTRRFLRGSSVQNQAIVDSQLTFILKAYDVYGRYTLHKAAFTAFEEKTTTELNTEAKHLLEWTTEQVLPALLAAGKGTPLQELDLSRISFVNDSIASIDLDTTLDDAQLTPLGPPRKKGNIDATPERLDGTFEDIANKRSSKRKDSKIIPGDSAIFSLRCLSLCILQSSLMTFSEWLSVGAGSGTNDIRDAALQWFAIFDKSSWQDETDDRVAMSKDTQTSLMELLPAFAKLSLMLGLQAEDKLFQQFISACVALADEGNEGSARLGELVQDLVSKLLKSKPSAEERISRVVSFVLEVAYTVLEDVDSGSSDEDKENNTSIMEESFAMPSSMHEVVCATGSAQGDVVGSALHAIMMHKQGSLLLAQKLSANFGGHVRPDIGVEMNNVGNRTSNEGTGGEAEGTHEPNTNKSDDAGEGGKQLDATVLFEAKCLWLLWDSGACRKEAPFKNILRDLSVLDRTNQEFFNESNPVSVMIEALIENIE